MVGDGKYMDQPRPVRAKITAVQAGPTAYLSLVSSFSDPLSSAHLLKLSLVSMVSCSLWPLSILPKAPYLDPTHLLSACHLPSYLPNRSRFPVTDFISFTALLSPEATLCNNICPSLFLFSLGP